MKVLYKLYQLLIALPLILIATVATSLITCIGSLIGNAHFWGYYPGKWWSIFICRILLLPVHVEGRDLLDKHTSYVFIANHQGIFDIFLIYGFLQFNFKWMMKKELRKMPFVGIACEIGKHIFVDRSTPSKLKQTLLEAYHTLQDGMSLVVFPEGTRSYTGHLSPFQKGAFRLADELQLPIVPLTLNGPFEVLPRTVKFGFIKRVPLSIKIHAPIQPQGVGVADLRDTIQKAYNVIESGLPEKYRNTIQ